MSRGDSAPSPARPLGQPHLAVLPLRPLATLSPLGAAKRGPALSFLPQARCPEGRQVPSLPLPCLQPSWLVAEGVGRSNVKQPNVPPPPPPQPASAVGDAMTSRLHVHISVGHPLHRLEVQVLAAEMSPQSPTFVALGMTLLGAAGHPHPVPPLQRGCVGKGGHALPGSSPPATLLLPPLRLSVSLGGHQEAYLHFGEFLLC